MGLKDIWDLNPKGFLATTHQSLEFCIIRYQFLPRFQGELVKQFIARPPSVHDFYRAILATEELDKLFAPIFHLKGVEVQCLREVESFPEIFSSNFPA